MDEIMFTITDENEENMKLLVRVMRKADWMLSVSNGTRARKLLRTHSNERTKLTLTKQIGRAHV